ncbi:hypothetical protein PGT21_024727 [Puccinia graminis f. sp. tritici]|uniref:Uncharacterized protein n=2 Tax=Puccinia graminis f. sp. tritici TaxID=56615 RepID=E3LC38_PUCGT|nr:uncharacterized protein PGTG_20150 [Puccinia graminis f. sp. tritici CRL 75-36-700-3]EFP94113.2 hypothetical protein PGTG_20150 [Puccinia graminis f. sp. tritici CRL 75-36-700-3]KAA1119412.1 hypothetical protein PGT21_024727 [Puccinia graminis f. sp. tritici]
MSNIIFRDGETAETTFPEAYLDPQSLQSPSTAQDDSSNPVENLEEINQNILFGITPFPAADDIPMNDNNKTTKLSLAVIFVVIEDSSR